MDPLSIAITALVGWCGTPPPIRWPPHIRWPPVPPGPDPICPVCGQIASLIGAFAGVIVIDGLTKGADIPSVAVMSIIGAQLFGGVYLLFAAKRR